MAEKTYIQRKAELWNIIKEKEAGAPTIGWNESSPDDLAAHIEKLEQDERKPLPLGDYCRANCNPDAKKYIRFRDKWGWEINAAAFGVKVPYYVHGPLIEFCPWCGRRMEPHG